MRSLVQIIIKEFLHIFRDYRSLLVIFGMPALQLIIFGYAIRTEINDAEIGILDYSKDAVTQQISNKILSSGYFKLNGYLRSNSDIEKYFKAGKVKEVIIFESGFAEKLNKNGSASIQVVTDASNPNLATIINNYTSAIIQSYQKQLNEKSNLPSALINYEVKMLYNPELKSVNLFVPGLVALILMLICALLTSITITREKEMGNMEILLVSPLKPGVIILGKVFPYIFISIFIAALVLALGLLIFGVPFKGGYILLFSEILLYLITALALGILISTVAKTQQVAMMVSLAGLLMPTVLLSGFIFPVENMPLVLQIISYLIPARWFLIIIKSIMLKGLDLTYIWKETLVLAGMSLFFFVISMKKLKVRLD